MSPRRTSEEDIARQLAEGLTGVSTYSERQQRQLVRVLHEAAAAVDVGDEVEEVVLGAWWWPYRLAVLVRALNAEAARALGWRAQAERTWTSLLGSAGPGGLTRAKTRPLVDANIASASELATLPGLGPATARRVVAARPYRRLDEVRTAAGLSASTWEKTRTTLTLESEPLMERWPAVAPGVPNLFTAVRSGRFELPGQPVIDPEAPKPPATETAVATIAFAAEEVAARRTRQPLWAPSPARLELGSRGIAARDLPGRTVDGVAPVRGSAYPRLLLALLKQARNVDITMFFVSGSSALDELLDTLGECRARGGRVRCLLADSLQGDVRGAADVNAPGAKALRRRRVTVRRWWPEVALHEKSVVLDGRHVVVGSHNWTAGSFYRHDETTLYVDSQELAADLDARFERRWRMVDPDRRRRVVALAELACLPREAVGRLEAEGVRTERDLPEERPALRALARRTHVRVNHLAFAASVAGLMRDLRVAEVTAGCLVTAGLTSPEKVASASREQLLDAIVRPRRLPDALDRRPVNPAIADLLPGRV